MTAPCHVVVFGVSGCGKSTVAAGIAERTGRVAADADDFHPPANVAKMSAGVPLTDEDRAPWLEAVRDWMTDRCRAGERTVVACSALRRAYRDVLRGAEGTVVLVLLDVPRDELERRLRGRTDHFMPASLLDSQLATLEPPQGSDVLVVEAHRDAGDDVEAALAALDRWAAAHPA
ncbi:gluconokinase [Actinotalea sp. M2MS4P-6]|uniref:gluconokinase n=1 Tax=Actinotalea sp. M2MS4P-6 TaxID=2983762 RepID=UPI0021E48A5B|nr:gluconokinase [Actinotalea sp. M2MS4P-6]MCV2393886.1 gluconokinase [Actinotalea sp. M2MS4P-6]